MLYHIELTQEDIDSNFEKPGSRCSNCPLALAIQRATNYKDIYVGISSVFGYNGRTFGMLPKVAYELRRKADNPDLGKLEPTSFDIELELP